MSKTHIIDLKIINKSSFDLTYSGDWFQFGGLASGYSWPSVIPAHGAAQPVECCESHWSLAGCSGRVDYNFNQLGGKTVYLSFSNPAVGDNKIGIGPSDKIWNSMSAHYDYAVSTAFPLAGENWLAAYIESSSGERNNAVYTINVIDTSLVTEANIQLKDVASTFASIPTTPSYRKYYKCDSAPTSLDGLAESHFKGIACYEDKFVFSHTDLEPLSHSKNGKWIVADDLPGAGQAETRGTFDTLHTGWPHPCASQGCGSFMAQGIQQAASGPGANVSEIEILDIRMTAVNQSPQLLGVIPRPNEGVNGVGMTKEAGADGRYIVGAVNGESLTFYRSQSSSLIENGVPTVAFDLILQEDDFPESGAGLAMVTQQDGGIFFITLNADDDGSNSIACLYQLCSPASQPTIVKVSEVALPVNDISDSVALLKEYIEAILVAFPVVGLALQGLLAYGEAILNSSFRWGKGLAITSENSIELYASDRNVLPLSSIPLVGSKKDFSVVVWASGGGQK